MEVDFKNPMEVGFKYWSEMAGSRRAIVSKVEYYIWAEYKIPSQIIEKYKLPENSTYKEYFNCKNMYFPDSVKKD